MKEREIPEGVSDIVVCPVCKKFMTWKISNVTGKYAWHCRNIHCSEYNPEQVDKEQVTEKKLPCIVPENCIKILIKDREIQDMTGIPLGQKVMVIDMDTEGANPDDLSVITWETGEEPKEAIISIWEAE